jgi:hypothetical protein
LQQVRARGRLRLRKSNEGRVFGCVVWCPRVTPGELVAIAERAVTVHG